MNPVFKDGDKEYPLEITGTRLSDDGKSIIVSIKVSPEIIDSFKVGDKVESYFKSDS